MATFGFLVAMLDFAEKMMFARLDFSKFLICYSGYLSGNKSEETSSVAICGGSCHNLAYIDWPNSRPTVGDFKIIYFIVCQIHVSLLRKLSICI